jgi:teichuronic acid biosynthesis glycosyltransferase TuaG
MPKVSIILATHNGQKYLKEAIESVQSQTYIDWELIIINDASTDMTQQIIDGFCHNNSRMISLQNSKNLERSASRNRGINIAKGEYIAFLDDDDIWLPEKLEKQVVFLDNNPEYGFC